MTNTVTLKGQPLTLRGTLPKEKTKALDCELVDQDLHSVRLSSFKGKILLLISVPSVDTPVCSLETKRFNKEVAKYQDQVNSVVVSMDLPFAQKRWCGAEGVKNVSLLSDYKKREFATNYGVWIEELGLLARAVFICDQDFIIQKVHLVKEVSEEPPYAKILEEMQQLLSRTK